MLLYCWLSSQLKTRRIAVIGRGQYVPESRAYGGQPQLAPDVER